MLVSLLVVTCVALVGVGTLALRWRLLPAMNGAASGPGTVGLVCSLLGTLFAILLGLAIVSVWSSLTSAQANLRTEATAAREAYTLAEATPAVHQRAIRTDVRRYLECAAGPEWQDLQHGGQMSALCTDLLRNLQLDTANWSPADPSSI